MDAYKVLAIDGGGIRGVIPARVLQAIEERCGKPIATCFDAIAGTSTGGIIALGLSCPGDGDGDRPRYRAADMLGFYLDNGSTIFPHSIIARMRRGAGAAEGRFSAAPLEQLLRQRFGDVMLSQALTEIVIPSYDLSEPGPFFFKREYAQSTEASWDVPIWQVARATSAAPTYFDPAELQANGDGSTQALVDGGTFANNPATSVYADALRWAAGRPIVLVSVGTGQPPQSPGSGPIPIAADHAQRMGLVEWVQPILEVVLDGVAKAVEYQMGQIDACTGAELVYHRLQSDLPTASHAMDDASAGNLTKLQADAETLIAAESAQLDAICAALTG